MITEEVVTNTTEIISIWSIIIPSLISLITCAVTIVVVKLEFINAKKKKIVDDQRDLYCSLYTEMDKILNNTDLVIDEDLYNTIYSYKGRIKIIASNNVAQLFEKYILFYRYSKNIAQNREESAGYEESLYKSQLWKGIKEHTETVLDAMRKDLGNDKYEWDSEIRWQI